MGKYRNIEDTKKVGIRISELRKAKGFSIEDIAEMTGFSYSSLHAIENGRETGTSYLIEIAKALGVHPMEVFDIKLVIKPRFKLSAKRQEKHQLSFRIRKIYSESKFLDSPRFVNDIIVHFESLYQVSPNRSVVSGLLKTLTAEGLLTYTKVGRRNLYVKAKSVSQKRK